MKQPMAKGQNVAYTLATYNTLPPNASVFNKFPDTIFPLTITETNALACEILVPMGYVFYLRKINFDVILISTVSGVPSENATFSIQTDMNISPFNQNILTLPLTGEQDISLIANQGEKIQVFATYNYAATLPPSIIQFGTQFIGHAIPVNNMPTELTALKGNQK